MESDSSITNVDAPRCVGCRHPLSPGLRFCTSCGRQLVASPEAPKNVTTPPAVTTPTPTPAKRENPVVATALVTGALVGMLWDIGKFVLGAFGLVILIGGFAYSHNATFKTQCAIHKEGGPALSFPKNAICALDFQIKPE
jgi:hypothetical protein